MDKKQISEPIVGYILLLLVLFGMYSCTRWKWDECRKVGHGVMYCIMKMDK